MILGAITHNYDIMVGLRVLFSVANQFVAFGHADISSYRCRCGTFYTHSAVDAVHYSLGPLLIS